MLPVTTGRRPIGRRTAVTIGRRFSAFTFGEQLMARRTTASAFAVHRIGRHTVGRHRIAAFAVRSLGRRTDAFAFVRMGGLVRRAAVSPTSPTKRRMLQCVHDVRQAGD